MEQTLDVKPIKDIDKIKIVVFGDKEANIVGLVVRQEQIETWREQINQERTRYKAYFQGVAFGIGFNLLFSAIALAKLFEWI